MKRGVFLVAIVFSVLLVFTGFVNIAYSPADLASTDEYSLDVYTKRGGKGPGEPSGTFKVGELIVLFGELKKDNIPVEGKLVSFEVWGPPNPYQNNLWAIISGYTNSSGVTNNCFRIGPMGREHWEEIFLGTWLIKAGCSIDQDPEPILVTDTMSFNVTWDLAVDLFTQRGGEGFYVPSGSFKPGEVVSLNMRVTNRTVPMPNVFVEFRLVQNVSTNEFGIATISFRLPWKNEATRSLNYYALMQYADYAMHDYLEFEFLAGERIPGDINYDNKVDIRDISVVAKAFGSYLGHSRWDPEYDLNCDGRVDIKDLVQVAVSFGKTLSP